MRLITEQLPAGWEEKAKELGAMQRASGVIRTAESLLRLVMLYITNNGSFQMAAIGMALTEGITMSKVAAFKRMRKCGGWLRWMAKELCATQGATAEKPAFLGNRSVRLIDASDETTKGKNNETTYRVHYDFNPFEFTANVELTTNKEGEKLTRHEISKGDIIIADRIYCTMSGIEHVLVSNADFLLRFKSKAFNLFDKAGERIDLLSYIKDYSLNAFENADIRCFYKLPCGTLRPIRIVAMKKDEVAIAETKRKMSRKVSKKQEKQVQADTVELNEYVVLATSLDYTNEQILELYRARWQIEQVFYRLKSLFGYDNVPSKCPDSVMAWFYGKLMLAALCESILKKMPFPPEPEYGETLIAIIGAQCLG